ncbi:MAG: FG-GAP-like repeat-containing protein, partial [Blastocatellia bacterium]
MKTNVQQAVSLLRSRQKGWLRGAATIFAAFVLLTLSACTHNAGLPKPESKEYRDLVSAFYVGLAGLQTGEDVRAKDKLTLATQIAPGEPASWANLGLLAVRQQEFDTAFEKVEKARSLAPDNSQIEALLGLIESRRGKLPEAIAHLNKAVELDAKNLKALYALAQETERQAAGAGNGDTSDAEAQKLLERILVVQPDNLAVLLDVTRLAAKRGDGEVLKKAVARLAETSSTWPDEAKQQLTALQQIATSANPRAAATQSAFLKNVLARVPAYRQSMNAVKTPAEFVGDPFLKFIKLPSPSSQPAPPDDKITFTEEPIAGLTAGWDWIGAVPLDSESKPTLVVANSTTLQIVGGAKLAYPGMAPDKIPGLVTPAGVLVVDLNYDFKTDFVLAGRGGLRFYQQESPKSFIDITFRTGLPSNVLNDEYWGSWSFDFDLDGDLDLLVAPMHGAVLRAGERPEESKLPQAPPIVLRNNGDGTFKVLTPFENLLGVRSVLCADFDADGDTDLAILTSDRELHLFENLRLGNYRPDGIPNSVGGGISLAASDLNNDGVIDLLIFTGYGEDLWLLAKPEGGRWEVIKQVEQWDSSKIDYLPPPVGTAPAFASDFDNNGELDVILSGYYGWEFFHKSFTEQHEQRIRGKARVLAVADMTSDGKLDLLGLTETGQPVEVINRATKNYH